MRNFAGWSAAFLVVGLGSAQAQDVTDWSGFYASVHAGYGLGTEAASGSSSGPTTFALGGGSTATLSEADSLSRIDGLFGGLGAGYNYQHGIVVLGVDGQVHLGNLGRTDSSSTSADIVDAAQFASIVSNTTSEIDLDWYTTLTGSFGIAFEQDWMVYLKGGAAIGNVSSRSTASIDVQTNVPAFPFPSGINSATTSSSGIVVGPTFGLGLARKITENISLGAEYAFVGLPDQQVTPPTPFAALGGGAGAPTTYAMGFHSVKATLKYHF